MQTQDKAQSPTPKKSVKKKAARRKATKKKTTTRKRVAKKKSLPNTAPYPAEYRQKVVAVCLGLPFERVKHEISERGLTVIPSTAWDWKRSYEKNGPDALIPKRAHVRDVSEELKRLADVSTANLRKGSSNKSNGNGHSGGGWDKVPAAPITSRVSTAPLSASTPVDSIRKVLELHNEHRDVFDEAAVIALIGRIVGV